MENNLIDENKSIFEITELFPETIPIFLKLGFLKIENEELRKTFGKTINLKIFSKIKNQDLFQVKKLLNSVIKEKKPIFSEKDKVVINGLLPCPVRFPIESELEKFKQKYLKAFGIEIISELKAASSGIEWIKTNLENLKDFKDLPDIFISAGFDLFFSEKFLGKYRKKSIFEDLSGINKYNETFKNIELKDMDDRYTIISVVPAVFLVNMRELEDRPFPKKWCDLFRPEFEKKISLPIEDFDLFNALLLNIYKLYGENGIIKLKKSMMKSLHPAEMVKSEYKEKESPIVTIIPYFFTKMIKENSVMKAYWPNDGAIISPIFMLSKGLKKDIIKPITEFLASKTIGNILSHNGLFPSTNPEVNNFINEDKKFIWLGWDFIKKNDISALIELCTDIFNKN
jgi:ABC-type Fe3+ transport system substrate-binding protein